MVVVVLATSLAAAGCSSLLGADPTPVPGAAATLTRSERTPIPTPPRTPVPSPAANASPVRASVAASPAPSPIGQVVGDDEVAQLQQRMEQITATRDLPGIESLLLDHVSLSTPEGGSVLDSSQTAGWLRDHASSGIKVTRVERSTQTVMLQVLTEGWPTVDPIVQGQLNFSLRRYDASGRPDEDKGDWKIDVIDVE